MNNHFLKLFKDYKLKLCFITTAIIISVILSIIIPLKTGNIIDTILQNITIKNNNNKVYTTIKKFKPFINDIETINFEALNNIVTTATVNDLVSSGLIQEESLNNLDRDIKEKISKTNIFKFYDINCYECNKDSDYIRPINNIYNIIDKDTYLEIKNIETNQIIYNLVTVVTFAILIFIINYFANKEMSKISKNITYDLRTKIIKKLFKISLKNYSQNKEGDILSLLTNDIDNISSTIATELVSILNSIVLLFSLIIIMFKLSLKLSLIILGIIPIMLILLLVIVIKSSKYFKGTQDLLGNYNDFILNSYNGYKTIRSFNQKENFIAKEKALNKDLYNNVWKSNFYSSLMQPIVQFAGNINFLVVCIFGSILVINGKLTIGTLQAFLTYAKNFNSPLIGIASTIGIIEQTLASSKRINDFLNLEEELEQNKYENYNFKQDITFENVNFSYTNKNVLENINLNIKNGDKVAIVGETGSGKTTLIKLLLKLYEPNSGTIKIGNKDIRKINKATLRDNICVVLQDSWLFEGSIKDNINYGSEKNDHFVETICKKIKLDKIINKLPNKYNYVIEKNNQLSKGEKQLISIARAFMQNKDVLILDEATSNIDIETEAYIKEATEKLMENKTCLIIAHRLSTIIKSDKIIVMHEGKIVEIGTHKNLIKMKGYYYKLYNSQFE